jgi:Protein of unknown function (DUF3048) N-terminal domain/Protein of unknown function (DUF3048) C-terminal domain
MIDDVKPVRRPRSLQENPNQLQGTQTPVTPSFQTPETVAATDDIMTPVELVDVPTPEPPHQKPGRDWRQTLTLHWPPHKKEFGVMAAVLVLLVGGVFGFLALQPKEQTASAVKTVPKKVVVPPKPVITSVLSGLPITDAAINNRPVTAVMIENSLDARPQSGLGQASVVFEAIAEGGVTRFLALFQDTAPASIGPVRSARPYYVQWSMGFDAGYAHVGGSPEALANIKAWGVRDLDQFYNSGAYQRISSRVAPHNVYTSAAALEQLQIGKGYTTSKYTGFARKKESASKQPTAKSINFALSGPAYNVHYDYEVASNSYKRSEGGAAHIDANTNTQINPKVVIALVVPYSLAANGYHSQYAVVGSGQAYVYQDGVVTVGQWSKAANHGDSNGQPLSLNPGQTWLTAVSAATKVTSTP